MKRKIFHLYFDPLEFLILLSVVVFGFLFLFSIEVFGANKEVDTDNLYSEPFKVRCTCYCYTGNKGADGTYPREGLTVAGKKEWLGSAVILYEIADDGSVGDVIGIYQFRDTGFGMKIPDSELGTIQTGQSIDVYRDDIQGCRDWVKEYGDHVYIQVIQDVEG